ncbi:LuxR C-terminal-related transcriptional regulator [Amycolatopsis sp. NPDC051102]|uniref:response regulator transcription factor n=1 Tax=Amycolatopsis sp. NPDC051102 TaxID=3155163 RepID=UPI0034191AFC
MCRGTSEAETGEDLALDELIRLARRHQDIAHAFLSRAEKMCREASIANSAEDDSYSRWNFTGREDEVAQLLVEGLSNRRIARALGISERTVKNHLHSIFYKLHVGDRTQAVIRLMRRA